MAKLIQQIIACKKTQQAEQQKECNYSDNYYGDQVCR